ncbi:phosphotransferase family protein [Paenibacillus allorhizosphaerae]|uniref:Aminoglycoside phosphotransferase domain-containing protein n=1 Tax=Paenibacillus allorhizosphaerae TaxID=2849866 RepID=A0ABM8VGZ8_9BACL|nr:aminoglycoside phosphotransferase family protein [Paenibacillus allorhizosphaerae]CAG7640120.1 hypothetical protein PAECIP111802_02614 [Paenibacillus allorhizosphaerae]
MNEKLLELKLEFVKAEMGELPYQTFEFITTGCEKDVLVLDKKTVISFYRNGLQLDPYGIRQELIRRLGNTEAALPECLYISPTKDFVVETYVPGYRISPEYVKEHLENAKHIGRSIGRFLRQLHMKSKQGLDLKTGFAQDVRNDMEEGIKLLETKLSESEMSQVMNFLNLYYKISASIQTCVVHGDFHYDNIFWDEKNGRLGVIDFNEAGIEDPALDFMYMCYYPEEFRHAVFEEYDSKESNLYERSQLYDRIYGLYDMVETIQNNPRKPDFQKGYKRFFEKRTVM